MTNKVFSIVLVILTHLYSETEFLGYVYNPTPFSTDDQVKAYTLILPCYPSMHNEQYLIGLSQLGIDVMGVAWMTIGWRAYSGRGGEPIDVMALPLGATVLLLNRLLSVPVNKFHNKLLAERIDKKWRKVGTQFYNKKTVGMTLFSYFQDNSGIALGVNLKHFKHNLRVAYPVYSPSPDTFFESEIAKYDKLLLDTSTIDHVQDQYLHVFEKHPITLSYDYSLIRLDNREILLGIAIRHSFRKYVKSFHYEDVAPICVDETSYVSSMHASARLGFSWQVNKRASLFVMVNFIRKEYDYYLEANRDKLMFLGTPLTQDREFGFSFWL